MRSTKIANCLFLAILGAFLHYSFTDPSTVWRECRASGHIDLHARHAFVVRNKYRVNLLRDFGRRFINLAILPPLISGSES
jgi:hypothetical protein